MKYNIKWSVQTMLSICVVVLVVLCTLSISAPIRFNHQKHNREVQVKRSLLAIRKAEEKYRIKNGVYTANFSDLVKQHLLPDSAQFVPFGNGAKFSLQASTMLSKSGRQTPLMECSATYDQYLDGLDENSVACLVEQANNSGLFPGLKIGDINEPNNNAPNW